MLFLWGFQSILTICVVYYYRAICYTLVNAHSLNFQTFEERYYEEIIIYYIYIFAIDEPATIGTAPCGSLLLL